MATKTISLDLEAYRRLFKNRKQSESFSDVVKRMVPEPFDFDAWLKHLQKHRLSDDAIAAIEEQVANRRNGSRRGGRGGGGGEGPDALPRHRGSHRSHARRRPGN